MLSPTSESTDEYYIFPASFAQQRMWFLDRLEPGNPAYLISAVYRISGNLDAEALERSLNEVVARHESLRTTFAFVDDEPVQMIRPELTVTLEQESLEGGRDPQGEARLQERISLEMERPFNRVRWCVPGSSVWAMRNTTS